MNGLCKPGMVNPLFAGEAELWSLRLIRALRVHISGVSQRALASQMGVTEARVSQLLNEGGNVTIGTVERVLRAHAAVHAAQVDTRRMAETGTGSGRSPGSAVGEADAPTPKSLKPHPTGKIA